MIVCLKRLMVLVVVLTMTVGVSTACLNEGKKSPTPTPTTVAESSAPTATTAGPGTPGAGGTQSPSASPDTSATTNGDLTGPSVAVSGIFETPDTYNGETVTTHGEVEEIISSNAFTIVDDNQVMLVLGSEQVIPDNLTKGQFVQMSGAVHAFDVAAFEGELGVGLEDELYSRFVDQPAMMLTSIQVGALAIDDLLANVGAYGDRTVNVIGQVSQVVSVQVATLGDPASTGTVLVATPFASMSQQLGATAWVRVVGTVTTFDTSNVMHLGPEFSFLDAAGYSQFNGQPIILGTSVEVVAPSATTTVGDILAQPEGTQTDDVTVSSRMLRRITDRAFTIGTDGRELLVLVPEGAQPADVTTGALLVLSGTAQTLSQSNPPQVSGQPIDVDLNDANLAPFLGHPVLVAQGIQVVRPGTP